MTSISTCISKAFRCECMVFDHAVVIIELKIQSKQPMLKLMPQEVITRHVKEPPSG